MITTDKTLNVNKVYLFTYQSSSSYNRISILRIDTINKIVLNLYIFMVRFLYTQRA